MARNVYSAMLTRLSVSKSRDFVTAVTVSVFVVVVNDEASRLNICCDAHWPILLQLLAASSTAAWPDAGHSLPTLAALKV